MDYAMTDFNICQSIVADGAWFASVTAERGGMP
jgi:hypothetical protein